MSLAAQERYDKNMASHDTETLETALDQTGAADRQQS